MQLTTTLHDVRTALANRRTTRVARRRLSTELASFRSTADRAELEQMLSRHPAEETREIRAILYRQDVERQLALVRHSAGYRG